MWSLSNVIFTLARTLPRAAYSLFEVILMNDSLSAVGAYVGKVIHENCILNGPLTKQTRILVTYGKYRVCSSRR